MQEHTLYYAKPEFYEILRRLGGIWNDPKERPIMCLIKLEESDKIYWAIPMGNLAHRSEKAQKRILKYLSCKETDIKSCFYHIGKTDQKSIFFISDIIPITDKYIDRAYINKFSATPHTIKNKSLIRELTRKAKRILSFEYANPNYYRQHITDIKNYLINELTFENKKMEPIPESHSKEFHSKEFHSKEFHSK